MNKARIKFEVFGRRIDVERTDEGWAAYVPGNDGKRRRAEIVIPSDLTADEIGQYLGDLLHEAATPRHPNVRVL